MEPAQHASQQQYLTTAYLESLKATNGKPITCKAAVAWEAKKPLDVTDVEVAPPKVGEVRVKIIANALCHTDIYTLDGHDPEGKFPSILGHEAAGVVESVGEGVTSLKTGDIIIPCYTPECREYDCIFCQSERTNLCPKIRSTQGAGVMPDGTSRFSKDGKTIYHFMGCSSFAEYTVIAEISAAKINPRADLSQMCMLGCGVSTGWGAVFNNCNVQPGTSVAVFGLGAVGLAVIQAAKAAGAKVIAAVDLNPKKFEIAKELGATHCYNPADAEGGDVKKSLLAAEKWGYDFTFDCTGVTKVMRDALEVAHRGWGESCVIGVAAAGHEISTRPFQLVTGRVWKGTAFGGWKSRTEVPKLVQSVMRDEMPVKQFLTHTVKGLENVNDSIKALHSGDCLRAVVEIGDLATQGEAPQFTQIENKKVEGGYLKRIKHQSACNNCEMTFSIFIPKTDKRTEQPPAVLFYLSGLTCTDENARTKAAIFEHAAKYNLAVVFPDTSARGVTIPDVDPKDWKVGESAGFYLDATTPKWAKHNQNETYVTKELPELIDALFTVDLSRKAITGHSMGGHGAISLHLKNPGMYKSVSAFAPLVTPSSSPLGKNAFEEYLGSVEAGKAHDSAELIAKYQGPKPLILVDQGAADPFLDLHLFPETFRKAAGAAGYPVNVRMQPGYDHSYYFVSSFMKEHVDFHATNLGLLRRS